MSKGLGSQIWFVQGGNFLFSTIYIPFLLSPLMEFKKCWRVFKVMFRLISIHFRNYDLFVLRSAVRTHVPYFFFRSEKSGYHIIWKNPDLILKLGSRLSFSLNFMQDLDQSQQNVPSGFEFNWFLFATFFFLYLENKQINRFKT